MHKKLLMLMIFSFLFTYSTWGDVIVVQNGDSIQDAIDISQEGDRICVEPGTYEENIRFPQHQIILLGVDGPQNTIIDAGGGQGTVVHIPAGHGRDTKLQGFTIRDGGDGIYCGSTSPTIVDNIIEDNRGSGIYCFESNPIIIRNIIRRNTGNEGGGIFCLRCSPMIADNTIEDNQCNLYGYGGGIWCGESDAVIKRNVIRGNTAEWGAGICCVLDSNPHIDGNTISYNDASYNGGDGGGIYFGVYLYEPGLMKITNNIITGNKASYGGGIFADESGGSTLINNTITGNEATVSGGGIAYSDDGEATLTNTILWKNVASNGHEIALLDGGTDTHLTVTYSDVEGGASEVYIETGSSLTWGAGNLSPPKDPEFYNPDDDDFHLQSFSPCKDEGDNSHWTSTDEDFERNPRIWDGTVDMGADEFAPNCYPAWERAVYAGDVMLKFTGPVGEWLKFVIKKSIVLPPKVTPYGDLYLARPFKVFTRGPIPASGIYSLEFTAPPSWMPGDTIYIQALIDSVLTYPAMLSIVEEPPPPEYAYDDGSPENLLGWTGGGDMCWMNRFDTIPGGENITSVKAMFGCAMYPGYGPGNGTPATVCVWDDPTNDGDPNDCVLLGETATTVQHEDTDTFIDIALVPPVAVSGSFFVGCCLPHAPGEFVAPFDTDTPYIPGSSWYCGSDVPGNFDPNNLAGLAYPPAEWTNFWCLRAGYQ